MARIYFGNSELRIFIINLYEQSLSKVSICILSVLYFRNSCSLLVFSDGVTRYLNGNIDIHFNNCKCPSLQIWN